MKLHTICNKVATKCLSKPGTIVECMDDADGWWGLKLQKGKMYEVASGCALLLKLTGDRGDMSFLSTRFRKAD